MENGPYIDGLRWFTCQTLWFSVATLNNQRVVWVLIHCFIVEGFHPIDWWRARTLPRISGWRGRSRDAAGWNHHWKVEAKNTGTAQVNSVFRNVSNSCIWCIHTVLEHVYVRMYICFLIYTSDFLMYTCVCMLCSYAWIWWQLGLICMCQRDWKGISLWTPGTLAGVLPKHQGWRRPVWLYWILSR
jgi:hypothetical protein